ncbi:Uncharacterised protein [Streptococcus suis]|uniref:Uncharacterized protein n=1 Tax=Streptococcus suis TaxID=1307 RepID=A0A116KUI3_STRSU|nr:Uncharacterised protein [Streptococcus suis]CYU44547.1 Uncharacterised protein [Streptococcus suis]CYU56625.1 Uncharacterised protein [Streptococcus suis]
MSIFTPVNIIFALVLYPMFIINYHRRDSYLLYLLLFLMNALVALYSIIPYFASLK